MSNIEHLKKSYHEINVLLDMTTKEEYFYDILICAIECIDKQIPKLIEKDEIASICPRCGSMLGGIKYCSECGQRLQLPGINIED